MTLFADEMGLCVFSSDVHLTLQFLLSQCGDRIDHQCLLWPMMPLGYSLTGDASYTNSPVTE
jgi:hypothetical protein